ncbi:hypothetical protein LCGC14_0236670 [marine sediment metagenome]|jgi:hypothetical protein|uniref:Uncharacterized protein n=1 Tax=marine sediment metagenome TaxID=412755 RepID=A0A0F9U8I6_9ZZZZ
MKSLVEAGIFDRLFVFLCSMTWKAIRVFNPYRLQKHFAGKVNTVGFAVNEICRLPEKDAVDHICRINNNLMKDGINCLAKRGDLVKIVNPANGEFVMRFVHGAGEHPIKYKAIGLDYEAKKQLGVVNAEAVDLQVVKANAADREFYLMYQDRDVSSRHSRALGWYILIGSISLGVLNQILGFGLSFVGELM